MLSRVAPMKAAISHSSPTAGMQPGLVLSVAGPHLFALTCGGLLLEGAGLVVVSVLLLE